jgi:glutathione S-transferase
MLGSDMLQLFHWEPNGDSARVMICLTEKGLEFSSRYVDVLALEQLRLEALQQQTPEIPLLVHRDAVLSGPTQVCEYLEETFTARPLLPRNARARWRVRVWQKQLDDGLAASVSELAWEAYGAAVLAARDRETLREALAAVTAGALRTLWGAALAGLAPQVLVQARERVREAVARAEADLASSPWLAGEEYTLADIAAFSYLNFLPALGAGLLHDAPRTRAWLQRVRQRPAVTAALSLGREPDPFAICAPGPEQIRWG